MQLTGVKFETKSDGIFLHQSNYINKLRICHLHGNYEDFRPLPVRPPWTTKKGAYFCCAIAFLARVTEKYFKMIIGLIIKTANTVVQHLKVRIDVELQCWNLKTPLYH